MKQTINVSDFRDAFRKMDRSENFTYAGLGALFEYLEDIEDQTGEEMELDVIALCCDFSEYADLEEFQGEYGEEYGSMEDIEERTTIIMADDTRFIIQTF